MCAIRAALNFFCAFLIADSGTDAAVRMSAPALRGSRSRFRKASALFNPIREACRVRAANCECSANDECSRRFSKRAHLAKFSPFEGKKRRQTSRVSSREESQYCSLRCDAADSLFSNSEIIVFREDKHQLSALSAFSSVYRRVVIGERSLFSAPLRPLSR